MQTEIFKVLADKNRNTIVTLLIFKDLCVCDIEEILNMKQANVSKHMMKLKKEKIVDSRKEAQWVYYRINEDFVKANELLINYLKEKALSSGKFNALIKEVKDHNHCQIK